MSDSNFARLEVPNRHFRMRTIFIFSWRPRNIFSCFLNHENKVKQTKIFHDVTESSDVHLIAVFEPSRNIKAEPDCSKSNDCYLIGRASISTYHVFSLRMPFGMLGVFCDTLGPHFSTSGKLKHSNSFLSFLIQA